MLADGILPAEPVCSVAPSQQLPCSRPTPWKPSDRSDRDCIHPQAVHRYAERVSPVR
ncbi:hypothetical protein ZHAS_00012523 [Anopheles sinensis]|uniref:Uncharacterized protein n=1 Tax=Anopheles sinensis TaxID=74873 RepID=A0A084W344_ANOSI|nr:hypothetical protein ZHAS_00012523 [Anopheles sinensis]